MKLRALGLLALTLLLNACATTGYQTKAVLDSPPDVPRHAQIDRVEFVSQEDEGLCGPTALTMAIRTAGKPMAVETLTNEIYTADKKGTLPAELISASRNRGLLAVEISGLAALLQEVAAGHPVIIFENLAFSWWPQWHYSVVVGYDLDEQEVVRHSGTKPFMRESLNYFERGWKLADYWGLVVLPPSQLAASAGQVNHLKAAVGLEKAGHQPEAEQVYRNVLKRWPDSLGALIGLGNLAYQRGNYSAAVNFLEQAVKAHPYSSAAQHNLRVTQSLAQTKKP